MLQLHDTTRRRVCIAGFILLGLLPALLIGGWCADRHLPGCARDEAERLGRQLGLAVKLKGISHLRPGVMLYQDIELADPETGETMLRCPTLEIACRHQIDESGQPRSMLEVIATQPEVEAASLSRSWRWLLQLLEGKPDLWENDVHFSAAQLTLKAERSQTLSDVEGLMETLPVGTRAEVNFRLAGTDTPEPARIRVVRNRQSSPPASGFELYTGGGELPCNVLAMGVSELKPLGPRCRFHGYIWANETPDGWNGEVTGQLVELNLGDLVADHFPHHLSGIGEATIQSARFRRGRLEEGSAILAAGPGTIDRSLAAAAMEHLGLVQGTEPFPDKERIEYDHLAISVTLDAQGLRLRGCCPEAESGTILSDSRGRLLGESPQGAEPIAALVQTLAPPSALQVPTGRQTDWLLRHLPAADVVPPIPSEDAIPTARLKLPETWQR
jgi:hypothetical protein